MSSFAKFYLEFLKTIGYHIGEFFKYIGNFFVMIYDNFKKYFTMLIEYSADFGVMGWIFAIIVLSINFLLIIFIFIKILQFLRRYLIFRKKEVEKDRLLEEIAQLNDQTMKLIDEKNSIMNLKISALNNHIGRDNLFTESIVQNKTKEKEKKEHSRFVKLTAVDQYYMNRDLNVYMTSDDMINLHDLVKRFVNFSASQLKLYYTEETIRLFIAGLGTSKIMILEGVSGTGKTSLPYAMGKFFKTQTQIVSVQPSWRDRAEILGYFNEFTKKFNETDFLKILYEVTYRKDVNFIILDEMNLARIEYYFADFLSMLEMPDFDEWKIDLVSQQLPDDPKNLIDGKIIVPQNVWFIGTANKDDSTFTITDKVYDRASTLEFNHKGEYFDAPYTEGVNFSYDYLNELFQNAVEQYKISNLLTQNLNELDQFIQSKFKLSFGNRILKQIYNFIPIYMACGGNEVDGLDYLMREKVLRKFESLNISFMHKEIDDLILLIQKLFGKNKFKISIGYLKDLKKMM